MEKQQHKTGVQELQQSLRESGLSEEAIDSALSRLDWPASRGDLINLAHLQTKANLAIAHALVVWAGGDRPKGIKAIEDMLEVILEQTRFNATAIAAAISAQAQSTGGDHGG